MPKPDHEVARLIARAMTIGADPEDLLRIEAGARRRKPATPPHTRPKRDPDEHREERVPFPPPQTRDAVSDFRARKLISRIERPAKIAEWLDLITDTVSAWADANRRASPTDQQVADWGGMVVERVGVLRPALAPRAIDPAVAGPARPRPSGPPSAAPGTARCGSRGREASGRTNAALAGLFEVSVRTIQRAKAWGRDRCRGGVTAPCTGFFAPERKTAFKQLLQGAVTPPVKAPYMSLGEEGGAVL